MKSIVMAAIATLALAGTAVAQESNVNWSDSRVELNTDFDGSNSLEARTGITLWGYESYGQVTVSGARRDTLDVDVELGQGFNFGEVVSLDATIGYTWGGSDGTNIIGFGDTRTWGTVDAGAELTVSPGLIGGEYVFASAEMELPGVLDYDFTGGEVGAGYVFNLTERSYLDASVSWAYDDEFNLGADRALNLGVGFKF